MVEQELTFSEAIRDAIAQQMRIDKRIFVMGEDVQISVFGATRGLVEEFGPERVRNTPISEAGFVGAGAGAAASGMIPVVEILFADFLTVAFDQIVNQIAKMRYMFGGKMKLPIIIRTSFGGGSSGAAQHSQSPYSWLMNVPGLKIVIPSNPSDAKGLMKTSLQDNNPVIFWEHRLLYPIKGKVHQESYAIPFGKADVKRTGKDVTVVATGFMVNKVLTLTEKLNRKGIDVEVIDPRTLVPLDVKTIADSIKKTRKLLVVDEAPKTCGAAAEIITVMMEEAFDYLDVVPMRVTSYDVPIPFNPALENHVIPNEERIENAIKKLVS